MLDIFSLFACEGRRVAVVDVPGFRSGASSVFEDVGVGGASKSSFSFVAARVRVFVPAVSAAGEPSSRASRVSRILFRPTRRPRRRAEARPPRRASRSPPPPGSRGSRRGLLRGCPPRRRRRKAATRRPSRGASPPSPRAWTARTISSGRASRARARSPPPSARRSRRSRRSRRAPPPPPTPRAASPRRGASPRRARRPTRPAGFVERRFSKTFPFPETRRRRRDSPTPTPGARARGRPAFLEFATSTPSRAFSTSSSVSRRLRAAPKHRDAKRARVATSFFCNAKASSAPNADVAIAATRDATPSQKRARTTRFVSAGHVGSWEKRGGRAGSPPRFGGGARRRGERRRDARVAPEQTHIKQPQRFRGDVRFEGGPRLRDVLNLRCPPRRPRARPRGTPARGGARRDARRARGVAAQRGEYVLTKDTHVLLRRRRGTRRRRRAKQRRRQRGGPGCVCGSGFFVRGFFILLLARAAETRNRREHARDGVPDGPRGVVAVVAQGDGAANRALRE